MHFGVHTFDIQLALSLSLLLSLLGRADIAARRRAPLFKTAHKIIAVSDKLEKRGAKESVGSFAVCSDCSRACMLADHSHSRSPRSCALSYADCISTTPPTLQTLWRSSMHQLSRTFRTASIRGIHSRDDIFSKILTRSLTLIAQESPMMGTWQRSVAHRPDLLFT